MKIVVVHEVSYLEKIIYEYQILPEMLSMLGHELILSTWRTCPRSLVHLNLGV